jgi:alpha-L-fucosidase
MAVASGHSLPPSAVHATPSSAQMAWQQREMEMFIHFGINTFANAEWTDGRISAARFQPSALDARQWVSAAEAFGAKGVVLTCKHHDGFCLWPTATTDYSVASSPWRAGRGNVVAETATACREAGLAFGVYLSPADLHEPTHGRDGPAYTGFVLRQLRELLTGYGPISEVWFDGADPTNGRRNLDFHAAYRLIRALQPGAVIVSKGPDVRWVGNENGTARESEWSVIPLPCSPEACDWPDMTGVDLGGRTRWAAASEAVWYPAVANVALRPNWFWNAGDNGRAKPVAELLRIHELSWGRNAGLLLNVSPDTRGLVPEDDFQRLTRFGEALRRRYGTNFADGARWTVEKKPTGWMGRLELDDEVTCNALAVREDVRFGQFVERWFVKVRDPRTTNALEWASGTTIGHRRLVRGQTIRVRELEVEIPETRGQPKLLRPELHMIPGE